MQAQATHCHTCNSNFFLNVTSFLGGGFQLHLWFEAFSYLFVFELCNKQATLVSDVT